MDYEYLYLIAALVLAIFAQTMDYNDQKEAEAFQASAPYLAWKREMLAATGDEK